MGFLEILQQFCSMNRRTHFISGVSFFSSFLALQYNTVHNNSRLFRFPNLSEEKEENF